MGWCNDAQSKQYNKLIKLPSIYSHEKLYKKENVYDIILVLNYIMLGFGYLGEIGYMDKTSANTFGFAGFFGLFYYIYN